MAGRRMVNSVGMEKDAALVLLFFVVGLDRRLGVFLAVCLVFQAVQDAGGLGDGDAGARE